MSTQIPATGDAALYRTLWRWHFYAAMFVIPFVLILATTGAIYLFKPQIDSWQEREFRGLSELGAVTPTAQLDAAMRAFPGAQFHSYRLPESPGDAAMIHLGLSGGNSMRDVFVSPQGEVLGTIDPDDRLPNFVILIHGELLGARVGGWPRERRAAGVVWPRLGRGSRVFWRDIHAVTGFWVAGLALVLLVTALPWAGVWGEALKLVREEMGWVKDRPDWKTGVAPDHGEHDHAAMMRQQAAGVSLVGLDAMVSKAAREGLPFPVLVKPPGATEPFGPPQPMAWTIKSEAQNRPLNRTITVDMATGKELSHTGMADKHPIDQVVNYGIAWHEGALFGWVNQLIGLFTALALILVVVSGFAMWRRRKPDAGLGAPPIPALPARARVAVAILLVLAALLPLLALSLAALWLFDRLVLPRLPGLAAWLGLTPIRRTA
jgi:uncharacterized iron-regulated membrane protein